MLMTVIKRIHKQQGGFTLIEVLVVMTILGILAAIVSISLLGVTANARTKASKAELQTVQAAMDAMLSDQQVPRSAIILAGCDGTGTGTTDMTAFPSLGVAYSGSDTQKVNVLSTFYLREKTTSNKYVCDADGQVIQK